MKVKEKWKNLLPKKADSPANITKAEIIKEKPVVEKTTVNFIQPKLMSISFSFFSYSLLILYLHSKGRKKERKYKKKKRNNRHSWKCSKKDSIKCILAIYSHFR